MRIDSKPARSIDSTPSSSMISAPLTSTSPDSGSTMSSAALRPSMRSAKRRDDLAALDHRLHRQALGRAAVLLDDDAVLRHVDQPAGQIARVRGLQRRVGQTLARAVGRVEVFENGQPLLEVGDDRRLDDLARRLGHQAAHAGELLDLRRRAAGARMRHHVDRVDRLARPWSPACPSSSRRPRWSVQCDQASTTLLYFSPWVIRPSRYCCSNSLTMAVVSPTSFCLLPGL